MARRPMVTRTITTTEVTMMCVNIETKEVTNATVTLPRTYKDDSAINRFIEKEGITFGDNLKPVTIVSKQEVNSLYGMYEEEFVKVAKKMEGRTADLSDNDEETAPADEEPAKEEQKPEAPKKPKK